jgi:NADH dehydrogenase/NADH:ubiquinone oxidoreductase subunit G
MTPHKTDLQLALEIFAEQEERIVRQEALIQRLEAAGLPSTGSRALLDTLQELLRAMRDRITKMSDLDTVREPHSARGAVRLSVSGLNISNLTH